jgi:type VI secretion system protein ImpH
MASANRASSEVVDLVRALEEAPYKFNFFQAMRLIEATNPHMERIGKGVRPSGEPVRLGQEPSLAFAPSMIAEFRTGEGESADYLAGFFFGVFGPNGPLPLHMTERPAVQMDRPDEDKFTRYVGAMFGMAQEGFHDRDALDDHAKLFMAGRLSLQARPAEGLQAMLEDLFVVPMQVEQFVGEWLDLPDESMFRLGESSQCATLGLTTTIGARVWGGQHKFRIVCGPLDSKDFQRFLPGEKSLERLTAAVRNYVGDELDWELRLLLEVTETPNVVLGESGRLGWTSWVGDLPPEKAVDNVVIRPMALALN